MTSQTSFIFYVTFAIFFIYFVDKVLDDIVLQAIFMYKIDLDNIE